ncbi:MAG: prenyltransferase/squalene oxidase repeat-containing protein [Candidatus Nanopelagicales bacterium]
MRLTVSRRLAAASAAALLLLPAALATAPALAGSEDPTTPQTGLFGLGDPTFDGVYRQSWAIVGLKGVGAKVPATAISWLVGQQCPDGGYQSYRADLSVGCPTSDPITFSGPDSNSTALGAMALRAVGMDSQANAALTYLRGMQEPDGGFPFYLGGDSDANSTALALTALRPASGVAQVRADAESYLRSVLLGCQAAPAEHGWLQWQAGMGANTSATAQGALGLTTTLPATKSKVTAKALQCSGSSATNSPTLAQAVLAGASAALRAGGGSVASQFGEGRDITSTAQMTIALAAAKQAQSTVTKSVKFLKKTAPTYTQAKSDPNPGSLATLLVVADVTANTDPRSFGGVNLVKTLQQSVRP